MKPLLIATALVLLAGCASAPKQATRPATAFKFGLLAKSANGHMQVMTETRVITMRTNTADRYFGFEVVRADDSPYRLQDVIYLPGPPAAVHGDLVGGPEGYEAGIASQAIVYHGNMTIGFRFEDGDPLGHYRLAVYIDGSETEIFEFDVIAAQQ